MSDLKKNMEFLKAVEGIKRATTRDEMGKALDDYLDAHLTAYMDFPGVGDMQRQFHRYFKRVFGNANLVSCIMDELEKNPSYPVSIWSKPPTHKLMLVANISHLDGLETVNGDK